MKHVQVNFEQFDFRINFSNAVARSTALKVLYVSLRVKQVLEKYPVTIKINKRSFCRILYLIAQAENYVDYLLTYIPYEECLNPSDKIKYIKDKFIKKSL